MKRVTLYAAVGVAALVLSGLASAKQTPSLSGLGTPVFIYGAGGCFAPVMVAGQPNAAVGWSLSGTLLPLNPPITDVNDPLQSNRTIVLGGTFADANGEIWELSGTVYDTSIYLGFTGVYFDGFGDIKLKGDQGDHLYGTANVRDIGGPPELDISFDTVSTFPFVIPPDIPLGVTNCKHGDYTVSGT